MEVELKYAEDVLEAYSGRRPTVTYEDTEDLMRIFIKYLKMKMKSNECYAINTPLGIFYKECDKKKLDEIDYPTLKEDRLNEEIFINSRTKLKIRREYRHEDLEAIKENTNNKPIKN